MLRVKELNNKYWISALLTLALTATLVAVPCGAKTSCGQLDMNQLMNANPCNGLAGHATLFCCPVFTDVNDNEQTTCQDNQNMVADVQYYAQSVQHSTCQSNTDCLSENSSVSGSECQINTAGQAQDTQDNEKDVQSPCLENNSTDIKTGGLGYVPVPNDISAKTKGEQIPDSDNNRPNYCSKNAVGVLVPFPNDPSVKNKGEQVNFSIT
jgi:hypothetical protein